MKIKFGTNRIVIIGREYVYKLPVLRRGVLANDQEYKNYCRGAPVAATQKRWYGLKQERLTDLRTFPRYVKRSGIPEELQELYNKKIHNRIQVGKDKNGCWKYFDYEDVKFYLFGETEPAEGV